MDMNRNQLKGSAILAYVQIKMHQGSQLILHLEKFMEHCTHQRRVDVPGAAQSEVLFYEEVLTVPDFSQRPNSNTHGSSEELIKELI